MERLVPRPELISAAQRGEKAALRALFDRFHPSVMSYCLLHCRGDRDAAKDRAQETFTRAFRHLGTLQEPERFRPWLFTIATNVCKRAGAQETHYQRALGALSCELSAQVDPRDEEERRGNIEAVRRLIERIEDEQLKAIVRLKYTSPGHTTRQIAEQLQIPHGTVTVKLMRFRASFKRTLLLELLGEGAQHELPA